jgi:lipid II:glycine glycyltransferase (peptidoglycan interpeptide bridge formation enzyme)
MLKWISNIKKEKWNEAILSIQPENIYQTNEWAEFKIKQKWKVIKLICINEKNEEIAFTHLCIKEYLKIVKINYTPGAVIINNNYLKFEETIYEKLQSELNKNSSIFNYLRFKTSKNVKLKNFELVSHRLSAPQTVVIETDLGFNLNNCSLHHKRKFKKNINEVNWIFSSEEKNIDAMLTIMDKLKREKKLKQNIITKTEINNGIKLFNTIVVTGYINGSPEVGCVLYYINGIALYICGGVTVNGRDKNLGYHLIKNIIQYLYENNIKKFDFGGIDINDENVNGVNRFKLGFGGFIVENSQELEHGNWIVKFLINKLIALQK